MKLQLIYDYEDYHEGNIGEDEVASEWFGYSTDTRVNSRLEHENTDLNEALYKQMKKYFNSNDRRSSASLIDIPDDIMLQYMIDGVFDMDYIVYNVKTHKICISNNISEAFRYGVQYGTSWGFAYGSEDPESGNEMFKFQISDESEFEKSLKIREIYSIVPDGEHYKNIVEVLRPYIVYKVVEWFKIGSDVVKRTQHSDFDLSKATLMSSIPLAESISNENSDIVKKRVFQSDETGSNRSWEMSYRAFTLCLDLWKNDHDLYLSAIPYLSEENIESYRLIYTRIMSKVSETKL